MEYHTNPLENEIVQFRANQLYNYACGNFGLIVDFEEKYNKLKEAISEQFKKPEDRYIRQFYVSSVDQFNPRKMAQEELMGLALSESRDEYKFSLPQDELIKANLKDLERFYLRNIASAKKDNYKMMLEYFSEANMELGLILEKRAAIKDLFGNAQMKNSQYLDDDSARFGILRQVFSGPKEYELYMEKGTHIKPGEPLLGCSENREEVLAELLEASNSTVEKLKKMSGSGFGPYYPIFRLFGTTLQKEYIVRMALDEIRVNNIEAKLMNPGLFRQDDELLSKFDEGVRNQIDNRIKFGKLSRDFLAEETKKIWQ